MRRVIRFIENDAARFPLVQGYSPPLAAKESVHAVRCADVRDGQASWYARVPPISNISDGLSRFDCTVVKGQGGCLGRNRLRGTLR